MWMFLGFVYAFMGLGVAALWILFMNKSKSEKNKITFNIFEVLLCVVTWPILLLLMYLLIVMDIWATGKINEGED